MKIGESYKLNQNVERYPKTEDDKIKYCGLKGQVVRVMKKDCGLCIVRNLDSDLNYWIRIDQLEGL